MRPEQTIAELNAELEDARAQLSEMEGLRESLAHQLENNDTLKQGTDLLRQGKAAAERKLAEANVDVRGMHIVSRDERTGIVALETADHEKAREVLQDILV